jgi:hypothetical protein
VMTHGAAQSSWTSPCRAPAGWRCSRTWPTAS